MANLVQGRKPWNATGERDAKTGKWSVDLSMIKPVVLKTTKLDAAGASLAAAIVPAHAAATVPAGNPKAGFVRRDSSEWKL